jgi:uncharacterized membrane protein
MPALTQLPVTGPPPEPRRSLDDVLVGRALAWIGGIAVCVGLAFLLAVAVSHGWLGHSARVGLGAGISALVLGAGAWLHERRGRTQASLVAAGAGIAGLFAAITVGAALYHVLPVGVGLGAAALVGAVATALAIRWSAQPVAALGIGGALAAPLLVGAPYDIAPLAFAWIAAAAATAVVTWRRWGALVAAGPVVVLPQWVLFLAGARPVALGALGVLAAFGALGAAAAIGHDVRIRATALRFVPAFLLALNAIALGLAGWLSLGVPWLVGLAAAHAVPAMLARDRVSRELRLLALVIGVALADAAAALAFHGPLPALGWAAAGVAFAALTRRTRLLVVERDLATAGLGVHVAIALIRALASGATSQSPDAGALVALAGVCAACMSASLLQAQVRPWVRVVLDACGLAVLAGLTAQTLDGPWLVLAWAGEGAALAGLSRRTGDGVAGFAGLGFLGLASLHATTLEAPPAALVHGADDLRAAAIALGAVGVATLRAARRSPVRAGLLAGAAVTGLYLASIAIVTALPAAGQLALSGFWALTGVAMLLAGLCTRIRPLRLGALALLGLAIGKVFLFDLATLTAGYRVASFLVLGLLLLVAGFAHERLRPS